MAEKNNGKKRKRKSSSDGSEDEDQYVRAAVGCSEPLGTNEEEKVEVVEDEDEEDLE